MSSAAPSAASYVHDLLVGLDLAAERVVEADPSSSIRTSTKVIEQKVLSALDVLVANEPPATPESTTASASSKPLTRSTAPIVIVEGLDGSGKSTLVRNLCQHLGVIRHGIDALCPEFCDAMEAFEKSAMEDDVLWRRCLFPLGNFVMAFASGAPMVFDRFWSSSMAYAHARRPAADDNGTDSWSMPSVLHWALCHQPTADTIEKDVGARADSVVSTAIICIELRVDESVRQARLTARGKAVSEDDAKTVNDVEFRDRVLSGFRKVQLPFPVVGVDANGTEEEVLASALETIELWQRCSRRVLSKDARDLFVWCETQASEQGECRCRTDSRVAQICGEAHRNQASSELSNLEASNGTTSRILARIRSLSERTALADDSAYACMRKYQFIEPTVAGNPFAADIFQNGSKTLAAEGAAHRSRMSVFDVGCGCGADARDMVRRGWVDEDRILAVDWFGEGDPDLLIRSGREYFGPWLGSRLLCADVSCPRFPEERLAQDIERATSGSVGGFHIVHAAKFLHCFDDEATLERVLRNIAVVLRRGGTFFGSYAAEPGSPCADDVLPKRAAAAGFSALKVVPGNLDARYFRCMKV